MIVGAILAASLAAADVRSGSTETRGRDPADGDGAVAARTVGEHAGAADLRAVGRFDEDGTLDTAFFRRRPDGTYELVASLSTLPDLAVLAELRSIANIGVRTVGPGAYRTVCGKGYGGFNCDAEEDGIRLDRDGVLLFKYESWSHLHYLRDGAFARAHLSD